MKILLFTQITCKNRKMEFHHRKNDIRLPDGRAKKQREQTIRRAKILKTVQKSSCSFVFPTPIFFVDSASCSTQIYERHFL